jgi:hypothetical protein
MAEPLQEESNALINREIAGVHHHRALRVHSRQDAVAAMAVAETRGLRLQQGAVLDPANRFIRGVPEGHILEGRTYSEHPETVAHGDGLASPEGRESEVEAGIGVDELLSERRVHVVEIGNACEPLHGGCDECGLFNCVDEIVPISGYHPDALHEHQNVTHHFLQPEACADVPDPWWGGAIR